MLELKSCECVPQSYFALILIWEGSLIKIYNYFKNMAEENTSQEFWLKNIVEPLNFLIQEIDGKKLVNKRDKKFVQF